MHPLPQLYFDLPQLGTHTVSTGQSKEKTLSVPIGAATDVSESKKVERLRFTKPSSGPVLNCVASELDQTGLFRVQS